MCYYNGQKVTHEEYIRLMTLEKAVTSVPFLNKGVISGFSEVPLAVLRPHADKTNFEIVEMEWGFLPPYLKNREAVQRFRYGYTDEKGKWHNGYTTLNATAENLFVNEWGKPSLFADAAMQRRCLVLSTGFFEWRHLPKFHKKTREPLKAVDKYPYYISVEDHEYFYMAGIWQPWTDKDTGEYVETLAIVTTVANPLMMQIHNSKKRMPCILSDELAWRWMMEELSAEEVAEIAGSQYPANRMRACSIAKDFQAALEPAEPFEYEDLPALELNF